jgi:hypothetical protein
MIFKRFFYNFQFSNSKNQNLNLGLFMGESIFPPQGGRCGETGTGGVFSSKGLRGFFCEQLYLILLFPFLYITNLIDYFRYIHILLIILFFFNRF